MVPSESLVVVIEEDSLRFSSEGVVTGSVCLRCGDSYFPEKTWDDFVAVVLGWWLEAAIDLGGLECGSREICFMDGPFCAELALYGVDEFQFRLVDGRQRQSPQIAFEGISNAAVFRESLIASSRRLLEVAEARGFNSEETEQLRSLTASLDKMHRQKLF